MRKGILAMLFVPLASILLCAACGPDSAQPIYHFGREYEFNNYIIKAELNAEEENFLCCYKVKSNSAHCVFSFKFTYNTLTELNNSIEFEYSDDNGNEIVFDENGYYTFTGDKTICISYKNANEEIKSAISDEQFSVYFADFGPMTVPVRGYKVD